MNGWTAELERLYREVGPQVRAYLLHRSGGAEVADELLQETFLAVAENGQALRAARSPRAWLIGIARNLHREHLRRDARRRSVPLAEDQAAPIEAVEDPRLDAMRLAIARLPGPLREVVELRLTHGLRYAEIAEALDIPVGTVRSRLHNAVVTLRDKLGGPTEARPT